MNHPILPMAGEAWQLSEIQCHSKLAARRFQKPKKGLKLDGSDDSGDVPSMDVRSSTMTTMGTLTQMSSGLLHWFSRLASLNLGNRVSFYWHHFLNALTGCGRMPHLFMSRLDLSMLLLRIFYILKVFCASLMPSYNGILTISCIRTLAQIALKLSGFIPFGFEGNVASSH
ncbi:hypothetical protein S245_030783 [Arachis hypogaea]